MTVILKDVDNRNLWSTTLHPKFDSRARLKRGVALQSGQRYRINWPTGRSASLVLGPPGPAPSQWQSIRAQPSNMDRSHARRSAPAHSLCGYRSKYSFRCIGISRQFWPSHMSLAGLAPIQHQSGLSGSVAQIHRDKAVVKVREPRRGTWFTRSRVPRSALNDRQPQPPRTNRIMPEKSRSAPPFST